MIKNTVSLLNVPNTLSFLRLCLTFVILNLLNSYFYLLAFLIFLVAALTDLLDGYLARKLNQKTRFGAWLDLAADSTLNLALIFYFYLYKDVPSYYLIILVIRSVLQVFSSILKMERSPIYFRAGKFNRWEPGMVFFVLFFLFLSKALGESGGPIMTGINSIILPYVFMPLSALTNLMASFRFLITRSELKGKGN